VNDDEAHAMGRSPCSDVDRFLGLRIKQLRLCAGLTQQQLAGQLSVSNQQVHKYEKGISRFSAERLLALARVFEVAVSNLFDGYDGGGSIDRCSISRPRGCCPS
jgi:transcriptional regulator with XRE-family HTH domain